MFLCHVCCSFKNYEATSLLRNKWVAAMCGFADRRRERSRQTLRPPTHSRHKRERWQSLPQLLFGGVLTPFRVCETQSVNAVSNGPNIGTHFAAHNHAVGRSGDPLSKAHGHCFQASCGVPGGAERSGKSGAGFVAASLSSGVKTFVAKGNFLHDFRTSRSNHRGPRQLPGWLRNGCVGQR